MNAALPKYLEELNRAIVERAIHVASLRDEETGEIGWLFAMLDREAA